MKINVCMILKSGKEIKFECDKFENRTNTKTGELENWSASNVTPTALDGIPAYVNSGEVAAILVKDYNDYSRNEPTIKPDEVTENAEV